MAAQNQLHFQGVGEGPPLLLLHGLFDSLHTWDALVPLLSTSFKTYAIDLPGFGKSPLPPAWTQSISQTVDAVEPFLNRPEKVSLVGNSMGAGIALALAQKRPDRVNRLILINPYGLPHLPAATKIARSGILKKTLPYLLPKPILEKAARSIYRRSFHNPNRMTTALMDEAVFPFLTTTQKKNLFRFLDGILPDEINRVDHLLPTLPHPTRILWGTEDRWLSFEHASRLVKQIPNCTLIKIHASGHLPQQEKPEEVADQILSFLSAGRSAGGQPP